MRAESLAGESLGAVGKACFQGQTCPPGDFWVLGPAAGAAGWAWPNPDTWGKRASSPPLPSRVCRAGGSTRGGQDGKSSLGSLDGKDYYCRLSGRTGGFWASAPNQGGSLQQQSHLGRRTMNCVYRVKVTANTLLIWETEQYSQMSRAGGPSGCWLL